MSIVPALSLPRYLQVAHWLNDQKRAISARETATIFSVSPRSIERDFAIIRALSGIVIFDEFRCPGQGGQQYLLRVLRIFPYLLDGYQQPHQQLASFWDLNAPLTWRDLLCRPWSQLVARHQQCLED